MVRSSLAAPCVFITGLVAGSLSTITSKMLFSLDGVDGNGQTRKFETPMFQTLLMFVSFVLVLPLHFVHSWYQRSSLKGRSLLAEVEADKVSARMLMMLAIPSAFSAVGCILASLGLMYIPSTMYQMFKSLVVLFVAIFKVTILKHHVLGHMWAGIFINCVAVATAGYAGMVEEEGDAANALLGIALVIACCIVTAIQFIFEEKMMSEEEECCPPLLVLGMEGLWGILICLFVFYPVCYYLPGKDNGSFELLDSALTMVNSSTHIQAVVAAYLSSILGFNIMGLFIAYMLSSVWKAILDSFRPVCVWGVDLLLFYALTRGTQGEGWNGHSYLQLNALALLLVGTAVYDGMLRLPGFYYPPPDEVVWEGVGGAVMLGQSPLSTGSVGSPMVNMSPIVLRGVERQWERSRQAEQEQQHEEEEEEGGGGGGHRRDFYRQHRGYSKELDKDTYGTYL